MEVSKKKINYLFSNSDLRKLIGPLIVEQLLLIVVGLVDSIMVASVGESAVSAVSLVDTIMVLVTQVFTALGTGGAVVAGQFLGQKNEKKSINVIFTCKFNRSYDFRIFIKVLYTTQGIWNIGS